MKRGRACRSKELSSYTNGSSPGFLYRLFPLSELHFPKTPAQYPSSPPGLCSNVTLFKITTRSFSSFPFPLLPAWLCSIYPHLSCHLLYLFIVCLDAAERTLHEGRDFTVCSAHTIFPVPGAQQVFNKYLSNKVRKSRFILSNGRDWGEKEPWSRYHETEFWS